MTALKHDRMVYFVLCRHRDSLAWAERVLDRTNRKNTLEDIMSGELPNVQMVIELNYVEFTSRDCTEDFVRPEKSPSITGQDRIDWQNDHARDLRKHEVVS